MTGVVMNASPAAIDAACEALAPIALEDLVAEAELLTRVDRKHLLSAAEAVRFLDEVADGAKVLELAGTRAAAYETIYFDTPDRISHRMAATGRRRRFKVRARAYLDTEVAYLEIKTRGARRATVKERIPVPFEDRRRLGGLGRAYTAEGLAAIGLPPELADRLKPALVTSYRRTTIVASGEGVSGERATVDTELGWEDPAGRAVRTPGLVVVETKSGGRLSRFERTLVALGHRPVAVSKFGVGMAALHPELPSNKWSRTLRTHFKAAEEWTGAAR